MFLEQPSLLGDEPWVVEVLWNAANNLASSSIQESVLNVSEALQGAFLRVCYALQRLQPSWARFKQVYRRIQGGPVFNSCCDKC